MKIRESDLIPNTDSEIKGSATKESSSGIKRSSTDRNGLHTSAVKSVRDDKGQYGGELFEYIKLTEYGIAHTITDAIERRLKGERVVSLREADILTRGNILLEPGSYIDTTLMSDIGFIMCEGTPGCDDSGWHLRYRYNSGLAWVNTKSNMMTVAKNKGLKLESQRISELIHKGRLLLDKIVLELNKLLIPPWPRETKDGFESFLLKPEFMTAGEYTKIVSTKIEMSSLDLRRMIEAVGN